MIFAVFNLALNWWSKEKSYLGSICGYSKCKEKLREFTQLMILMVFRNFMSKIKNDKFLRIQPSKYMLYVHICIHIINID